MNETSKTPIVVVFVVVVVLFLIFGGWAMTGIGGGMMGQGGIGGFRMGHRWIDGGFSWMWIPTLLTLGVGVLLAWVIFRRK